MVVQDGRVRARTWGRPGMTAEGGWWRLWWQGVCWCHHSATLGLRPLHHTATPDWPIPPSPLQHSLNQDHHSPGSPALTPSPRHQELSRTSAGAAPQGQRPCKAANDPKLSGARRWVPQCGTCHQHRSSQCASCHSNLATDQNKPPPVVAAVPPPVPHHQGTARYTQSSKAPNPFALLSFFY